MQVDGKMVDHMGTPMLVDEETGEVLAVAFFKTPYNHDRDAEALRTATYCNDKSLTDQSFKEETDINFIIERLKQGGPPPVTLPEHFGEQNRLDMFEIRSRIAESNATFYRLEPDIRSEFLNDPARWEEHVKKNLHEGNLEELDRMGLDTANWIVQARPRPPEEVKGELLQPPVTPKETETPKN